MRTIASLEELKSLAGQEVATSAWMTVTQEQVDRFAEATGDHQWIHVDVQRAARELPYGGTVAHGFLTLALLPRMLSESIGMGPDVRMLLNYGLNRVRFPAPLPVGRRVRGIIALQAVEEVAGGVQLTWLVTVECEGADKPVCVAEFLVRRY
ncbi:MAG TPA: MaoC family dehydratase [Herbaspirillum sp.]|uniref:MaoC family dehydratase n=1 Tax=Herbaspirillum sp. TaxID=1890675 RepID=UPI002D6C3D61|nr:MaoC family dehydratase [Herbaspirillum sp.]HZG22745.1 MaoC family dehydratase [Herbaspirillum sp.]